MQALACLHTVTPHPWGCTLEGWVVPRGTAVPAQEGAAGRAGRPSWSPPSPETAPDAPVAASTASPRGPNASSPGTAGPDGKGLRLFHCQLYGVQLKKGNVCFNTNFTVFN